MNQSQTETVGKVFLVVFGGRRKCLVCYGIFTPTQAAKHATTVCHPQTGESEQDRDTTDPRSRLLPR